jgi:hypothetical protein
LAQTITNSSSTSGNLGLNHTVFGKVKQISLSSYLKHSLHSRDGSDAPSPAPMHNIIIITTIMTTMGFRLQPLLQYIYLSRNPDMVHLHLDVHTAQPDQKKKRGHITPAAEPAPCSHHSASAASPPHPWSRSPANHSPPDPSTRGGSPDPSPPALPRRPFPFACFAHAHPPSEPRTGMANSAPNAHATRAGPAHK